MLEYELSVWSVKGANMRDPTDTKEWFIRFDDAESVFDISFMNNLGKATKALRDKSSCKDVRVRMITFTSDGTGFLLDSADGRYYK
jgi:hypothetical protein